MKNLINNSCALAALMLFFTFCKEKEEPFVEPIFQWGESTAFLNGSAWNATPSLKPVLDQTNKYYLNFYTYQGSARRHGFYIKFVDLIVGKRQLYANSVTSPELTDYEKLQASFITRISDGDGFGNSFDLKEKDETEDFLEITKIDSSTGEIWGRFQASFVVDSVIDALGFDNSIPDTLIFKSGEFHTKILD